MRDAQSFLLPSLRALPSSFVLRTAARRMESVESERREGTERHTEAARDRRREKIPREGEFTLRTGP